MRWPGTPLLLLAAGLAALGHAAPGVSHDQRQTGDLNVQARLDNVVVVLISGGSLLGKGIQHLGKGAPVTATPPPEFESPPPDRSPPPPGIVQAIAAAQVDAAEPLPPPAPASQQKPVDTR